MEPRTKASLLWGLVGSLTFLVLLQAYQLTTQQFAALGVVVAVTTVVGGGTALAAHVLRPWFQTRLN
ncbi:hypothetical protein [Halovenus halobia]|uniref:hypothetical protein n=1 Tax=Halovenus halobia TaxID=3396622 RepID=UPI003F561CCB